MTPDPGPPDVPGRRHFVSVWNPSYAKSAMDEHLALLLDLSRRAVAHEIDEGDVYVWWGKVRSANRQQPLAHASDIRALGDVIAAADETETQLYLTDYRSLYVADVLDIHEGDLDPAEQSHAPAYYRENRLNCDFWFRLADIRRLVTDDTLAVIEELQALRNVHYNDRPVSIYGGMVDLPLLVTRPDGGQFFDEQERADATNGRLWAEWDAGQGAGLAALERELRENLLGDAVWRAFQPEVRTFVAAAERDFRTHRGDAAHDFAPVVVNFGKALEVQCNAVLRRGLARAPMKARLVRLEAGTIDVLSRGALSLRQLARALGGEPALAAALGSALTDSHWFTGQLPSILDAFAEIRNPAAHSTRVDRSVATEWRDRMLGVGCEGVLVQLAKVRPR